MFIDVHAHLDNVRYEEDLDTIVKNAKENSVEKIITAGYDLSSSYVDVEIANRFKNVFACVGVHPENVEDLENDYLEKLETLLKNKKVVAIGEIGLDYHWRKDNQELQKKIFIEQIDLANKLDLPIVVHCRDAVGDTLQILKEHTPKRESLMHCYGGSVESAKEFIKLGFSFSFGGVVTFKNAKNVQEVVKSIPLEKIMLETDCPYMSPEPYRGKVNEPKNIPIIAEKIADIKNIKIDEVEKNTTKNAEKIFKI